MVKRSLLILVFIVFTTATVSAQCDRLRSTFSIDFSTDQDCAPVEVTEFEITYSFSTPQDPSTIQIVYEWNDPTNDVTVVDIFSGGLVVGGGNTTFTATANRLYTENNGLCTIQPTVSLFINGVQCTSSIQTQTAFFWGDDEESNAVMAMNPLQWEVCFDNPVVNARFSDASEFNCNVNVEPDHPNDRERHVQFVYGTNHNGGASIRDLSLTDGMVRLLTNSSGGLVSSDIRGTPGELVEAAYFGPVVTVPVPANGPNALTFPMNAPANTSNLIGSRFEITLFNWNVCNPWNGDPLNPNYEDAVRTRGYIVIVEAPAPVFITRDANGNAKTDFCIDEQISFRNNTPNVASYSYTWEFYDDAAGTTLLATSTARHPTYAFSSGGPKMIRLIARNAAAQGSCIKTYDGVVNITPSLTAAIGVTDRSGLPLTPDFCQESSGPLTNFDVRFNDISSGTATATTVRRWEFYDQNNNLAYEAPSAGGFSNTLLGPFDRVYITPGIYTVRLRVKDDLTDCESADEVKVRVFQKPQPAFTVSRVCQGSPTIIADGSTLNPIAGEQIVSWEWDMNYDGVTFNSDVALINQKNIEYTYGAAGGYQVALRLTTNTGNCSATAQQTVTVDPLPLASFTPDVTSGCSTLPVRFTNHAVSGQPDIIREFVWEVDDGAGFQVDSIQKPGDINFSDVFTRNFVNTGTTNRDYRIRLRVTSRNGCTTVSAPSTITLYPQPRSGFASLNYSPFDDNCSPVSVSFKVDNQTQSLNPTDYTWKIRDVNGLVEEISTGTTPSFAYNFSNATQLVKDFFITLRATLPSTCYGDSTRTIRISPVPSSSFAVDTATYSCDQVLLAMNATQKGLTEYSWNISINNVAVFTSVSSGETLTYDITRSTSIDQTVTVSLRTRNLANCQSTVTTKQMFIPRTEDINASFNVNPLEQTLPSATIDISKSTSAGPWEYQWDFGDGTASSDPNVTSHTYDTYGTYTVTLTVSNSDCNETVSRNVRINPIPPILGFDYFPPVGCAPHTVTFVNRSRYADPTSYVWKFGTNEGTSRAVDPDYTYQRPGLYSVTLSATNELGDTVRLTKELIIEVLDNPVSQFAVYPTTPINVSAEILYTDNRSRNATEYLWDFGDGTTSTEPEPQHLYSREGTFSISLIARNGNGCADTTVVTSAVTTVNNGKLLIPNAFIPNPAGPGSGNLMNNEVFLPLVERVSKFQMLVFNRWGELMFESVNPDAGWDGYFQGRLCPQDVYIYRISVEYQDGRTVTRTGDINLLR